MSRAPSIIMFAALTLASAPSRADDAQPQILPTRDVDITYEVTRPNEPRTISRRRWSASEHLQRVGGSDSSTTIFDADKGEFTLLNPKTRTYRKLEGAPRMPMAPDKGTALMRGGEAAIAGLNCVDWSWTDDSETHTACLTSDGVLLRIMIDGNTILKARSVSYRRQPPDLFQVPSDYQPALAPEGGPGE
jgi:hypothetical protein